MSLHGPGPIELIALYLILYVFPLTIPLWTNTSVSSVYSFCPSIVVKAPLLPSSI